MLKSVAKYGSYCHFSQHTRYHEIDKKNTTMTVSRYANELVSSRTTGHLIKKNQETGHYLCTKYILGCTELHFCECAMVE